MAIVKELFKTRNDGVKLFRTYSDAGRYVVQNETGIAYTEAIDVETAPYTYSEGDEFDEVEMTAEEFATLILGGDV